MNAILAAQALLPGGWATHVRIAWDANGVITDVTPNAAGAPTHRAPIVPTMPNLHSHAFQRAMAGLTETRHTEQDSFWSWRESMYRFANRLTPQTLRDIATWLYIEMLEAGYSHVCEFHYVHHREDGTPYANDASMCEALIEAAETAGIGLTLLPVLYQTSGFNHAAPSHLQRRFIRSTDNLLGLVDALKSTYGATVTVGVAPHSLRAVPMDSLTALLRGIAPEMPVHIHIAEQQAEVDACFTWCGAPCVEYLLDHIPIDARWCLVHATHMNAHEAECAARAGAVVGLCPTTEANLGDGIFNAAQWNAQQGAWGIGSDSHISVNPATELRMFEYSQRLSVRTRNVQADATHASTATAMWLASVRGGAQATGTPCAGLAVGQHASWVELNSAHDALAGLDAGEALSAWVFVADRGTPISRVVQRGRVLVEHGRHALHDEALTAFLTARWALQS